MTEREMTRREIMGGLALGIGAATPVAAEENSATIHQETDLEATPARVYKALLDQNQFSAFSGMPAKIESRAGGAFSIFGGHIVGRNVELIPDRRIVQAWRVVDWPEGVYSIARFDLTAHGSGTRIVFDHTSFPPGLRDHLASGWTEHYWEPLKKYFSH